MSNKEIIEYTSSISAVIKDYYVSADYKEINSCLIQLLNKTVELEKIPKKYNINQLSLTFSLGNMKIGEDTLCISLNTGLLCCMGLLGNCGNCNICYAVAENKLFFKNTVPKNTINQILINKVLLGEVKLHTVLFETIQDIYCSLTTKQLENLKFLRFNVEGDILNNEVLSVVNEIATVLKSVFNLISCYSYTHNTELDLSLATEINFNTSDFENEHTNKCVTISEVTTETREKIFKGEVILCNGDCYKCSYCKDKNNTKDILFLKHGGNYKGIEEIKETDKDLFKFITIKKEIDYLYFIEVSSKTV